MAAPAPLHADRGHGRTRLASRRGATAPHDSEGRLTDGRLSYTRKLHHLDGRDLRLRRSGRIWLGECPSCGYKGAFSAGDCDGRVLLHCHAGCPQDVVLAVLRNAGLWHVPEATYTLPVRRCTSGHHAASAESSEITACADARQLRAASSPTAPAGGPVLSIAGLWDEWRDPCSGEAVRSCTMIVTSADEALRSIHDRMPVLLAPESFDSWLSGAAGVELLRRAPPALLRCWPVSKRVDKPGNDRDATLTEPLAA